MNCINYTLDYLVDATADHGHAQVDFISLSIYLSIYLYIYLSICLSILLSIYIPAYLFLLNLFYLSGCYWYIFSWWPNWTSTGTVIMNVSHDSSHDTYRSQVVVLDWLNSSVGLRRPIEGMIELGVVFMNLFMNYFQSFSSVFWCFTISIF